MGSLRLSGQPADVLVVDNASQDHTTQRIESRYPEVRLIKSRKNLGFGRANNIGMKIACEEGYEAVFLLNQDAWIDARVLGILRETHQKYPVYGILSPVHLAGSGEQLESGFAIYARQDSLEKIKEQTGGKPVTLPFINAAFWYIPTEIIRRIGGFCPLFYHYGEDVDYVHRLRYRGYEVGYVPSVSGCHDRAERKNDYAAWLRSEEVYALTEYANLGYAFPKAFAYGVLACFKKAGQSLMKKEMRTSLAYVCMALRLMARTRNVRRYRRMNRRRDSDALYLADYSIS